MNEVLAGDSISFLSRRSSFVGLLLLVPGIPHTLSFLRYFAHRTPLAWDTVDSPNKYLLRANYVTGTGTGTGHTIENKTDSDACILV